ncbi:YhdH/YhfP family quinone oxidoreductase [Lacihabitans soyangensis]|uniref:Acryloyl-CoA reductase n=1 Tax=Lacihabitans soyangensis TaxID=869394 RepID=A0AAE3H657_9BACT|nr:YhdH/YhfP family quinone oxidoreductase [Lacihabitans soyangensis]MCP9764789.1 acryloyl-CoA reductase [Lacihabitans soyangensis]
MEKFNKIVVKELEDGSFSQTIEEASIDSLPDNDLLIKVHFSSLNFKDALSASGNKGVTKKYPHTPGIDAAGIVVQSSSTDFKEGDEVIVTGYDLGMNTSGGFSEYISVPAYWAIPVPSGISLKESMILGTAGLTAAMCVDKLLHNGLTQGPVIVSGATGGVGTLALMILDKLGVETMAFSRKESAVGFLKGLGTSEVIHSFENTDRPLLKPIFTAAIDTVGGTILENILKLIKPNGAVSICGMALSPALNTTVFPFILRGLSLFGIDSAEADYKWRKDLWQKLSNEWKPNNLEAIQKTVELSELGKEIEKMLRGNQMGRIVVKIS